MLNVYLEFDKERREVYVFALCNVCKEASGQRFKVPGSIAPILFPFANKQLQMSVAGAYYCQDCADATERLAEKMIQSMEQVDAARLN